MKSLEGKTALVTGGTRGIGYAISEGLAKAGATVIITSTNQEKSQEVAQVLSKKYGVKTLGLAADIADFDAVQAMINTATDTLERIDILVNNAGITKDNLLLRMSPQEWSDVITTNLNSVYNTTKAVIRKMLKNKYGRIINVSSVVGVMGNPGQANYSAAKAGMIGFTKSIAKEFGAKNITSNAIAPGFIQTDMIKSLPQDYLDTIIAQIPQQRLGQPEDIANVVCFLASDLASYITGQVINVDGGILM